MAGNLFVFGGGEGGEENPGVSRVLESGFSEKNKNRKQERAYDDHPPPSPYQPTTNCSSSSTSSSRMSR